MEDKEKKEENKLEDLDEIKQPLMVNSIGNISSLQEEQQKKKGGCKFPTAYTVLLSLELIIFILTYIIPKGQYNKIEYSSERNIFIIRIQNGSSFDKEVNEETLKELNIKIPLESFLKGYIKKPISIPNTYQKIEGEKTNFFDLFLYPVLGLIDSADISIFLFVLGGVLNILIEMNALSSGMSALAKLTKGKEFLLIILVFIIVCICGSIFGLLEEIMAFYPILMPVFLKNNIDGMLGASPIYLGSMVGNMFSTLNAFTVVIGSYSAGIPFINGIIFRLISFVLGIIITILYMYFYYKRVQSDEKKSVVYDIKKKIMDTCLKDEKNKNTKTEEGKNTEENSLLNKEIEGNKENGEKEEEKYTEKFTCKQKIVLLIFISSFAVMIYGIMALDWWFNHMAAVFIVFAIILLIFLNKGEYKGVEVFMKGAGDFIGVAIIVGIARGINITLEDGKISDTVLNSMSNAVSGLPKVLFGVIMLIIFIILGIFISSSTGLAILAMPILSPLADEINCERKIVVNTFMFGQYFAGIVTPTGLVLIALQLVGIPYNYWIKFIWPYLIFLFFFLIILVIIDVLIEG